MHYSVPKYYDNNIGIPLFSRYSTTPTEYWWVVTLKLRLRPNAFRSSEETSQQCSSSPGKHSRWMKLLKLYVLFTFNNNFSEVLTYIAPSTSQIFNTAGGGGRGGGEKPKPYGGQNVWNIHSKSRLLFTTLALVGSPLHALYKVCIGPSIFKKRFLLPCKEI